MVAYSVGEALEIPYEKLNPRQAGLNEQSLPFEATRFPRRSAGRSRDRCGD
jgi:hypothetical protein